MISLLRPYAVDNLVIFDEDFDVTRGTCVYSIKAALMLATFPCPPTNDSTSPWPLFHVLPSLMPFFFAEAVILAMTHIEVPSQNTNTLLLELMQPTQILELLVSRITILCGGA